MQIECKACDGTGEVELDEREHDTGAAKTMACPQCGGEGVVEAAQDAYGYAN